MSDRPATRIVADALLRARRDRQAADAAAVDGLLNSMDDAYVVQDLVACDSGWLADGRPQYWKSGGPSRASVLTHARLPDSGVWPSPASVGIWPVRLRLVESEVALRLACTVDSAQAAALTTEDLPSVIDAMTVSIEIVESRWRQGASAPALLRLADLQSHGALVLGAWVPYEARDWLAQDCVVRIGQQAPLHKRGSHSCGDPAWVVLPWLRHATRGGQSVPAGSVVTTGTWAGMIEAMPGDLVTVNFDGIGQATFRF
jgi:2-keto-4-pentenoate hydratase